MNRNFFENLNEWIRDTENSIVNFLSAFAPWLAPIIPAYMTYQHASETLKFPVYIAIPAALVVEILGFSAVSTYLSFWFYNRRNKAESRRAPLALVIIAFGFYLSLIVFSNVLLDSFPSERWAEIAVRALFTLQTIPAAMLVSVRTQHRELLSEISKERKELSENKAKNVQKETEPEQKVSENFPKDWRRLRPTLSEPDVANLANLSSEQIKDIARKYQVEERTVVNWRTYARKEIGWIER